MPKLPEAVIEAARVNADIIDSRSKTPAESRARRVILALAKEVSGDGVREALRAAGFNPRNNDEAIWMRTAIIAFLKHVGED